MNREKAEMIVFVNYNLGNIINECNRRGLKVSKKRFQMEQDLIESMIKDEDEQSIIVTCQQKG